MLLMPIALTCNALLFDMDGVLIDSTPAVTRVWQRWAREHGFDPEEVVRAAHGRPSVDTVRDYLPFADCRAEDRQIERWEIEDLDGVVALAGVCELISALPADRWSIVTSATKSLTEVRLRAAGLPRPRVLITASDISRGKPDAEPYLKAASALRIPPSECVVVEDVPAGIQAGKAAGARVIALRTTTGEDVLWQAGADWVLDSCADIAVLADSERLSLVLGDNSGP